MMQPPCKRCLLSEWDPSGLMQTIRNRIALLPESNKAGAVLYQKRLSACKECAALREGICAVCGCYAELRAADLTKHCPHEQPKW